jgi:hypothetical protein
LDYCPGGDCGGGGDGNSFGQIPNIFEEFFLQDGSSSGPAVWDSFTHLWDKAQLAGTLQSAGVPVSGGQILLAQADEEDEFEGPLTPYGWGEQKIEELTKAVDVLDEMGRPKYAHTPGGFLSWLSTIQDPNGSTVTREQADALVREARKLGLNVRLDPAHSPPNPWNSPHVNIFGNTANVHVLVPNGYALP